MANAGVARLRGLPSVDEVMRTAAAVRAIAEFGRPAVVSAVREALGFARASVRDGAAPPEAGEVAATAEARLKVEAIASLRPVLNLTGTVLHTNLGRALLPEVAIEAAIKAMRGAVALEFDLDSGRRGERDDHVRALVCELTGAEDATVVNNNAAAVLLVLNTFANGREAIVSRGELIEIGGAFRIPEIMARSGAKLVEVGTTNRTHLKDYVSAIGVDTGLILKVHTSNYKIEGFTAEVGTDALAEIARKRKIPLAHDLGSGTLVDLARWGLVHEPTVAEAVDAGADLVTFSGDKLLGGPQCGFVVGRKSLIAQINRNPLKRTLRVDKIRLAALEATLKLYRDPDRLAERLPTLALLVRPLADIEASAHRLVPSVARALGPLYTVEVANCRSQIGSGALPTVTVASSGLVVRPASKESGGALDALAAALRRLSVPVIGRLDKRALVLDLRCLDDEDAFVTNLAGLDVGAIDRSRRRPKP